ncbi:MAG: glucokinase [Pseudomonadota bacterium]
MIVLAGDIGGTKTLLQLSTIKILDKKASKMQVLCEQRYKSTDFKSFSTLLDVFISQAREKCSAYDLKPDFKIATACLAIAGPIQDKTAKVTNLPWLIKANDLKTAFDIDQVELINDFKAVAYAIEATAEKDLCILQRGKVVAKAPKVVIGAGTGLGSAFLFYDGLQYQVFSSESSHVAFAPINDLEMQLLVYLQQQYQQVSYEHIVSGMGLVNIFNFLHSINSHPLSAEFSQALKTGDQAALISQFALEKKEPIAEQSLDIFTQIYARQAANLALCSLAYGGVYIAGGIAPKIIKKLQQKEFLDYFKNNSNMGHLLEDLPITVLMNEKSGLIGASVVATRCISTIVVRVASK